MSKIYSPKIVQDSLVMCLDASNNKSYPTDLPVKNGLLVWLDAADDTTFSYSSGTVVSQWRDKSGLNNHVSQATVANQPSRSTIKNSRKTLVFDGSNDTLFNAGNVFPSNTTDYTKIAVVYQTSTSTTGNIISSKTDTSGTNNAHAFYFGNSTFIQLWHNSTFVTSPNALAINTLGVISGTYINSSGLGSLYVNGTASGTGTTASRNIVRDIQIGAIIDSSFFTGEICEVLVFSRVLSATELKQVHTYLGQKWGISNTDRSIVDLSNNNNNGLFGNGTVANMPDYDFYNKGAFKFNGTSDFVKVGPNSSLQVNNVTIAAFFKTVNNGQGVQFIAGYGDTGIAGYWLGTSGGPIRFSIGGGSGNYLQQSSGVTPNNDQIYYVVGTYDGANQRVYVDGVLQYSATTVTGNISYAGLTDGFLLGQVQGFSAARYLTGNIYNVSVYSRALSQAEISQNYEALKSKFANTIVQQGLVLNLDAGNPYGYAGAGTVWYDVSGNAIDASATGNINYSKLYNGVFSVYPSVNSYFATSTVSALNLGSSSFSIEAWVYFDASVASDDVYRGVMSLGTNSSNYVYISKWRSGLYSGLYVQYIAAGGTVTGVYQANDYNPVSRWTHVVATKSSNVLYFYVNGVLYSTASNLNTTFTGNSYVLIANAHAGVGTLNGYVGESRVYNTSLSAAQVLQNYNATKGRFGL